jgi:hypothetical protein
MAWALAGTDGARQRTPRERSRPTIIRLASFTRRSFETRRPGLKSRSSRLKVCRLLYLPSGVPSRWWSRIGVGLIAGRRIVSAPAVDSHQHAAHQPGLVARRDAVGPQEGIDALRVGEPNGTPPVRDPHAPVDHECVYDTIDRILNARIGEGLARQRAGSVSFTMTLSYAASATISGSSAQGTAGTGRSFGCWRPRFRRRSGYRGCGGSARDLAAIRVRLHAQPEATLPRPRRLRWPARRAHRPVQSVRQ